jgi:hypothetical protein
LVPQLHARFQKRPKPAAPTWTMTLIGELIVESGIVSVTKSRSYSVSSAARIVKLRISELTVLPLR